MVANETETIITLYVGGPEDVYRGVGSLGLLMGYPLFDNDLMQRSYTPIESADDIQAGDFIPFLDPFGRFNVLMNSQAGVDVPMDTLQDIVFLYGQLTQSMNDEPDKRLDVTVEYVVLDCVENRDVLFTQIREDNAAYKEQAKKAKQWMDWKPEPPYVEQLNQKRGIIDMSHENDQEYHVLNVFIATQEEFFKRIPVLAERMKYPIYDEDHTELSPRDYRDATDVRVGDTIPYFNEDHEFCMLTHHEDYDAAYLEKLSNLFGTLVKLPIGDQVKVGIVDLSLDDNSAVYDDRLDTIVSMREALEKQFGDVVLVQASVEQVFDFYTQSRTELEDDEIFFLNSVDLSAPVLEPKTKEDIKPGMMLAGAVDDPNTEQERLIFIGYDVEQTGLTAFIQNTVESMGLGDFDTFAPKITESNYDEYMRDIIVRPY